MMKKLSRIFIGLSFAAFLLVGTTLNAQAATMGLSGKITDFSPDNFWDIDFSTPVTGTAYWDENLLLGFGDEILSDFQDPSMNLEVNIGNFSYSFLSDPFPYLDFGFSGGNLQEISLPLGTGSGGEWFDIAFDYSANTNTFFISDWTGDYATGEIAPVPEPGTFLLLGAGLCGLFYVQRRRKLA